MPSMWRFGGLGWREVLRKLWQQFWKDRVLDQSAMLSFYFFNSYNLTYGSIGTVIILLLWFYLSGIAMLMGGELNSEIEKRTGRVEKPPAQA